MCWRIFLDTLFNVWNSNVLLEAQHSNFMFTLYITRFGLSSSFLCIQFLTLTEIWHIPMYGILTWHRLSPPLPERGSSYSKQKEDHCYHCITATHPQPLSQQRQHHLIFLLHLPIACNKNALVIFHLTALGHMIQLFNYRYIHGNAFKILPLHLNHTI